MQAAVARRIRSAGSRRANAGENGEATEARCALNPDGRYLYVPSGVVGGKSHLYAFAPVPEVHEAPAVESTSFGNVGEAEAELRATVNPKGTATHYLFQYTTQASYDAEGFAGALTAGEGDLPVGNAGMQGLGDRDRAGTRHRLSLSRRGRKSLRAIRL
jgi:hypothetical protein